MDPRTFLQTLVTFSLPIATLEAQAETVAWDQLEDVVLLTPEHLRVVLARFLANDLSEADVERWADLVEMREGIAHQSGCEELLKKTLSELATPEINEALSPERARKLIQSLSVS